MASKRRTQRLSILQNGEPTGVLERAPTGAVSFTYAQAWLEAPERYPLSMSLPLQEGTYRGAEVSSFFDNLLPDNVDIRNRVAQQVQAESTRTFDLLRAVGHDCVGSLQFLEEGSPRPKDGIKAKSLSAKKIETILRDLQFFPLGMQTDEPDFRISLAGVQEKTALLWWKDAWHLPVGSTPTTHVLKPPMGIIHHGIDLTTSVENEWICLKLCELFGLRVAKSEIARFGEQRCLVVERFDREWHGTKRLLRLPQEDICQAFGLPHTKKYESDGGPGIPAIMDLLNASDHRDRDREHFIRSQLAFYLLGATDGHGKNFSIRPTQNGFELTPLYDVMSVFPALGKKQVPWQKAKLAMAVGKSRHYRLKDIGRRHFEETAKKSGFSAKALDKLIEELCDVALSDLVENIRLPSKFPEAIAATIVKGIRSQAERLAANKV